MSSSVVNRIVYIGWKQRTAFADNVHVGGSMLSKTSRYGGTCTWIPSVWCCTSLKMQIVWWVEALNCSWITTRKPQTPETTYRYIGLCYYCISQEHPVLAATSRKSMGMHLQYHKLTQYQTFTLKTYREEEERRGRVDWHVRMLLLYFTVYHGSVLVTVTSTLSTHIAMFHVRPCEQLAGHPDDWWGLWQWQGHCWLET